MRLTETSVRLDPLLAATPALLLAQLAPVTDLDIATALHNIGDVPLRVNLLTILQDLHLVFPAGRLHVGV